MVADTWAGADFSDAACHVEGCAAPVFTYWQSCYAEMALCPEHEVEIMDAIELEEIDLSCCWFPFAWRQGA